MLLSSTYITKCNWTEKKENLNLYNIQTFFSQH